MFTPDQLAGLTEADRAQLTEDFRSEYGLSEPTAAQAVHLFLTIAAVMSGKQAVQQEFERAVVQMVAQGEAWATEFTGAMFTKRLPGYRTTYRAALEAGRDIGAALVREHQMSPEAAAELVTWLAQHPEPGWQEQGGAARRRSFLADISSPDGAVTVTVDPAATVPSATVRTTDTTGPSADAAQAAAVTLDGDVLHVVVPEVEPTTIHTSIRDGAVYQSTTYIGPGATMTGVTIDGNGTMHVGDITINCGPGARMVTGPSPIEVSVTVPPGSGVRMRSYNASLTIRGALTDLDVETYNGNLSAVTVGRVTGRSYNGSITIAAVQEHADLETYDGDITVTSYSGAAARLVSYNGELRLTATPAAHGRIKARTHNGDIRLRGTTGHDALDVSAKSRNGDVHGR
ncbi:DUF4097 family beta strand repeat protein [Streptomyces sp. SID2563]|uniref:DUF4097 family beta strand repeat-containing protein n=1 Tax=Streptomyces sp. SID2563 TaxID=2690255 RepID=UPI001371979E|nr:DUF4097 family beta strand repeat protein [Streptomyces sp. SID2563]